MNIIDDKKTYGVFSTTEGRIWEARIESSGAPVISFPVRESEMIARANTDLDHLQNLDAFDWVIFTDIFSAHYFIEALAATTAELSDLDALQICAVGENVVHFLRLFQIHSDLILRPREDQIAAASISEFAGVELRSLRFLVPTDPTSENTIISALNLRGAAIRKLPVYRTKSGDDDIDNPRLKALLLGGAVDEMVFSTADELLSLQFLFPEEPVYELMKEVGVNAANEEVFQSLLDCGLNPQHFSLT